MKYFRIESKFIADDAEHVTQYRRLVTPWFYFNLRPIKYELLKKGFVVVPFIWVSIPHTGWVNKNKDAWLFESTDKYILNELKQAIAELIPNNVVRLKR